jgi:hypothetical protein
VFLSHGITSSLPAVLAKDTARHELNECGRWPKRAHAYTGITQAKEKGFAVGIAKPYFLRG